GFARGDLGHNQEQCAVLQSLGWNEYGSEGLSTLPLHVDRCRNGLRIRQRRRQSDRVLVLELLNGQLPILCSQLLELAFCIVSGVGGVQDNPEFLLAEDAEVRAAAFLSACDASSRF